MLPYEINKKALDCLSKQNWIEAQFYFFENAQQHPSYQTYNNLGYYLISEGLTCKNGKTRNALNLGINYLIKSVDIKKTPVNLSAIVKSIDYQLRAGKTKKASLYSYACNCLKESLNLEFSYETMYNYLRFLYLADPENENLLEGIRDTVQHYESQETVSLYFEILKTKGLIEEAIECIDKYKAFLDDVDLLMFYSKMKQYEEGYKLCDSIYNFYSADKFIFSAIIECCIGTSNVDKASKYINDFFEDLEDHSSKKQWSKYVFRDIEKTTYYRRRLILRYKYTPPIVDRCCYFGCPVHMTDW